MPSVRFEVDAEVAKGVSAFLKVVEAQGKMSEGFKKVGSEARQAKAELEAFGAKVDAIRARDAASIRGASGADAVAAQIREEARRHASAVASGTAEIDFNNFANRQDKRRQYAGRLAPTGFAQDHPEAFDKLALVGMAGGIAVGGLLGLGNILSNVHKTFEDIDHAGAQFEDEIRGLLSLGNNLNNAPRVREQVMGTSSALGISNAEASSALFDLQSRAVNRGPAEQKQIFDAAAGLHGATGGNVGEEIKGLIALLDTYGKELGTADVAASKLLVTQERSGITVEQLSELLPTIAPAAKLLGHSFDETTAAIETTTHVLGNNEKVITGLREVFVKLATAQQEGIVPAGSLVEQFQALSTLDPNAFEKLFGARAAGVAAAMAQHTGEISENLRQMQSVAGGKVIEKFLDRMGDPTARHAQLDKSVDEADKNIDILRSEDPEAAHEFLLNKLTKQGIKMKMGPLRAALTPDWELQMETTAKTIGEDRANAPLTLAINKQVDNALKAGDSASIFSARELQLEFGGASGMGFTDAKGNRRETDAGDAQRYAEFGKKYGTDHWKDFNSWEEAREKGDTGGAEAIIAKLDAAADKLHGAATAQHNSARSLQQATSGVDSNTHTE